MLTYGVAVGSRNRPRSPQKEVYERVGFEGIFLERGIVSGREVGVDTTLASEIQWCALERTPGTVVLLTADGAGYRRGRGFFTLLERLYYLGWSIELLAYRANANNAMVDWVETHGFFGDLADHHDSITYVRGQRRAAPIREVESWSGRGVPESQSQVNGE